MFLIGDVAISNKVLAAPLAGVTDQAYRIIIKQFGCGLVCSEMVSSMGLMYEQEKTRHLADVSGEEPPVAVQIFGSQAEPMALAAAQVQKMGAAIIDINMGCPTPKVVKKGEGAALMLDIDRSYEIIKAVAAAADIPVTVKMRKGWDESHTACVELALAAQAAGASAVTVHPRTRSQFFSGQADWESIARVKKEVRIPVIGNGDIWKAADAVQMLAMTGCDAVMIGRGALGNPFIFRETVALLETGQELPPASWQERIATALKHLDLACRLKGEFQGVREMRKHLSWYTRGMHGAARIRQSLNHATTSSEVRAILQELDRGE